MSNLEGVNPGSIDQIRELISLAGEVAIITGAASGIGLEISKRLAGVGAKVALLDIDESRGKDASDQIKESGGEAKFYLCDVTSNLQCKRTIHAIKKAFGQIDVLVNNAGVIRRKSVVELEEAEWDKVMGVNLKGVYLLSKYTIPYMAEGGGGNVVNISSGWGLKGGPKAAAYCASKGGLVNLTRAMAIDHGKEGIRVNSICPGDTDTQLLRDEARQLGEDEKEFLQSAADRPIKRIGTPQDIANAVLYLVSDLSSWVTGANLVVDGGGLA